LENSTHPGWDGGFEFLVRRSRVNEGLHINIGFITDVLWHTSLLTNIGVFMVRAGPNTELMEHGYRVKVSLTYFFSFANIQ
jgi:hypothetical protein